MKRLLYFFLCLILSMSLFACGGGGGSDSSPSAAESADTSDSSSDVVIPLDMNVDATFRGGSFEAYVDEIPTLSYVYSGTYDFSGSTLTWSDIGTENPPETEVVNNVFFDDNRVAFIFDDLYFARSENDQYMIYGLDNDSIDKAVALAVKTGFTGADVSLANGVYKNILLLDDQRNNGSFVLSDTFDVTLDGSGNYIEGTDTFNYSISDDGKFSVQAGTEISIGQISENGDVIVDTFYDPTLTEGFVYLGLLIKKSSGKSNASLSGTYNFTEIDGDSGDGSPLASDLESGFGSLAFDGIGGCKINVGSDSFGCTYNVSENGEVSFNDGWKTLVGMISPDNNLVAFASDDSGNEGPFYFIATKR